MSAGRERERRRRCCRCRSRSATFVRSPFSKIIFYRKKKKISRYCNWMRSRQYRVRCSRRARVRICWSGRCVRRFAGRRRLARRWSYHSASAIRDRLVITSRCPSYIAYYTPSSPGKCAILCFRLFPTRPCRYRE